MNPNPRNVRRKEKVEMTSKNLSLILKKVIVSSYSVYLMTPDNSMQKVDTDHYSTYSLAFLYL
jgi:hypothetical protein